MTEYEIVYSLVNIRTGEPYRGSNLSYIPEFLYNKVDEQTKNRISPPDHYEWVEVLKPVKRELGQW